MQFFSLSHRFFDYWFPYCIHLYTWSAQQVTVAQHMYCFKTSYSPMFFPLYLLSLSHFNFLIRTEGFPFLSIWSAIPNFTIHLNILLFNVLLALLLVGAMCCLCRLYHNCSEWSAHNSWSCSILLSGKRFLKSCSTPEYFLEIWITYLLNLLGLLSNMGQTDWYVFGYCFVVWSRFLAVWYALLVVVMEVVS